MEVFDVFVDDFYGDVAQLNGVGLNCGYAHDFFTCDSLHPLIFWLRFNDEEDSLDRFDILKDAIKCGFYHLFFGAIVVSPVVGTDVFDGLVDAEG